MLVVSRKEGQTVIQDGIVTIHVLDVVGHRVTLGLEAPDSVRFVRGELVPRQDEPCGEGEDAKR
jgi:carbon storage regulator CsrA